LSGTRFELSRSWAPSPQPVLNLQRGYPLELGHVVGDADSVDGARVRRNQHVVRADRRPSLFEGNSNRGVDLFDVGLERSDGQRTEYGFDLTLSMQVELPDAPLDRESMSEALEEIGGVRQSESAGTRIAGATQRRVERTDDDHTRESRYWRLRHVRFVAIG